jgi:hypothetical protein
MDTGEGGGAPPPVVACIDGPPQAREWTTLGEEKVPGSGDPVVHAAGGLRDRVVDVHAAHIAAGRGGRPAPEEADVAWVGGTQGARDLPVHDEEDASEQRGG